MGHHHGHDHGHSHAPESYNMAFAIATSLNLGFVIIEAVYAIMANSMSLLADAGHNLGDVLGLVLAWGASWLMTRATSDRYSYGHKRSSILAAIINALLLVGTSAIIGYESINKLISPHVVNEKLVIIVALIGIVINGGTALLFMRGRSSDLNIKASFLHLAFDALISLGVAIAGVVILFTRWDWLDPAIGLMIVVTIIWGTWALLRDSVNLILDAVPHNIDQKKVRDYLSQLPGVKAIHDLHIWGLSTRESAMTAHLVMPEAGLSDEDYEKINHDLMHDYEINHVTLQVEKGDSHNPCGQVGDCAS
jgi:cobalt-zinc-cadmium efflux system protein